MDDYPFSPSLASSGATYPVPVPPTRPHATSQSDSPIPMQQRPTSVAAGPRLAWKSHSSSPLRDVPLDIMRRWIDEWQRIRKPDDPFFPPATWTPPVDQDAAQDVGNEIPPATVPPTNNSKTRRFP